MAEFAFITVVILTLAIANEVIAHYFLQKELKRVPPVSSKEMSDGPAPHLFQTAADTPREWLIKRVRRSIRLIVGGFILGVGIFFFFN